MAFFYFFQNDGECKWMKDQIINVYPEFLQAPVDFNGKKVKFYGILSWIHQDNKGVNIDWGKELKLNYVETIYDLPPNAGAYITGYDADLEEVKILKAKGVPVIENPCPWIKKLREQILQTDSNAHQLVLMIDKGHIVHECYKSSFPDDIIIIDPENYKEEIKKNKKNKPIELLVYATFREIDVKKVIEFINKNYPEPGNKLDGYKKSLCIWTKQGLFEEIKTKVKEHNLNEIWIICSSKDDTSARSIIRNVEEYGVKSVIIIKESDIPKKIEKNIRVGVLLAAIPVSNKVKDYKNIIREKFIDNN